MDAKTASSNRSYEDFEPYCKWHSKERQYILDIHLDGFKKDQLKVQVNNRGILAIFGERPLNASTWSRFRKEVNLPKDCDADEIQAKFSQTNEILSIVLPKKGQTSTEEPESKAEEALATSSGTEIEQKLALEDKRGAKRSKRRAMKVAVVVALVVMVVAIGTQIAQLLHRDPHQHHAFP